MDTSASYWVSPIPNSNDNVLTSVDVYNSELEEKYGRVSIVKSQSGYIATVERDDLGSIRIVEEFQEEPDVNEEISKIANRLIKC